MCQVAEATAQACQYCCIVDTQRCLKKIYRCIQALALPCCMEAERHVSSMQGGQTILGRQSTGLPGFWRPAEQGRCALSLF